MILEKNFLSELLGIGLSSGADFAEVFAENTLQSQMTLTGGSVEEIADRRIAGVGVALTAKCSRKDGAQENALNIRRRFLRMAASS